MDFETIIKAAVLVATTYSDERGLSHLSEKVLATVFEGDEANPQTKKILERLLEEEGIDLYVFDKANEFGQGGRQKDLEHRVTEVLEIFAERFQKAPLSFSSDHCTASFKMPKADSESEKRDMEDVLLGMYDGCDKFVRASFVYPDGKVSIVEDAAHTKQRGVMEAKEEECATKPHVFITKNDLTDLNIALHEGDEKEDCEEVLKRLGLTL